MATLIPGSVSMPPMTSRSRALASAALSTAALLLCAGPAHAAGPLDLFAPPASDAKPVAKREAPPSPEAIPLPGIVPAAVEAYRNLAAIRARTDPGRSLDQMLAPLDELGKAVEEAGKLLTDQPITAVSDRDLVDFRQEMLRQDALLEKWSSKLEEAVRTTYGSRKELERMEAVWTLTEQRAAAEGAAPAILARAQSVRGEIHDLGKSVRARLDRLLAAQDRVASLRIRILAWMEAARSGRRDPGPAALRDRGPAHLGGPLAQATVPRVRRPAPPGLPAQRLDPVGPSCARRGSASSGSWPPS